MGAKDWIQLLVPIFCNGVIVFILQKIFEKRQVTRTIKFEYASLLRQKIDLSLELYSKTARLVNEGITNENENMIIEALQQYVNSILDVCYYYSQNEMVFKSFDNHMEQVTALIAELRKCTQLKTYNPIKFTQIVNKIRDELMSVKKDCIKLHF